MTPSSGNLDKRDMGKSCYSDAQGRTITCVDWCCYGNQPAWHQFVDKEGLHDSEIASTGLRGPDGYYEILGLVLLQVFFDRIVCAYVFLDLKVQFPGFPKYNNLHLQ